MNQTVVQQIVERSEWIIPILALFIVAWTRFNSPPTNRSGTTFVMFFFGVIFYYALLIALWLVVIIGVSQGSIGFDWIGISLTKSSPEAQSELAQYAPVVAALIIVVASQFRQVGRIDTAARAFCVKLAAIPREADRLAIELAQSTGFQPKTEQLRSQVTDIINNISPQALNFGSDGKLASRFTRAVGLYWLFVGSRNDGRPTFPVTSHSKAVYARIMQLGETSAARADARYGELMHTGLAYFGAPQPAAELKEALSSTIREVSGLVCSLIARYVLCCEVTRGGRLQRLSRMGFDASHAFPDFGRDQWVMTILAVILLSILMMASTPGMVTLPLGAILTISITFGVSIGFAVMGAIFVAQRFIERHEGEPLPFPPLAELAIAALIVAGLTVALRIGIPLVPALIQGGSSGFQDVLTQFMERWPGVIIPTFCTISLGLLCSYLGSLNWSWQRIVAIGTLGNGLAFVVAGLLAGSLIDREVLAKLYADPDHAILRIAMNTGMIGTVVGAIVLAVFNKSQRVRKEVDARAADDSHAGVAKLSAPSLVDDFNAPAIASKSQAARKLGGYKHSDVEALEGLYVCFRPTFSSPGVINAYLIDVHWNDAASCLMFEEQGRVDAGHTQKGLVYIPEGRPFFSFVTVETGAVRVMMVSRPEANKPARGLIMTLSSPGGAYFTPASAPIVLKRVADDAPALGFIKPGAPGYDSYRRELDMVMPAFGCFATVLQPTPAVEAAAANPVDEVRLSIVR
jgi:hypothetical protein